MKSSDCRLGPASRRKTTLRIAVVLWLAIACLVLIPIASAQEEGQSLKSELASHSRKDGWALVGFDRGSIYAMPFGRIRYPLPNRKVLDDKVRTDYGVLALDGTQVAFAWGFGEAWESKSHLGIVNADGTDRREYPELNQPESLCWSHDRSRLALTVESAPRPAPRKLVIFDIAARTTEEIASASESTAQCWSPDDQRIVYADHSAQSDKSKIVIYDMRSKTSHELASGETPTWSPDGNRIAFIEGKTFYAISASGGQPKRLFKHKEPLTGLIWSPDSRLVAYWDCCYFWPFDASNDTVKLRVRRLGDGSDRSIVSNFGIITNPEQWIGNASSILSSSRFPQ